MDQTKDFADLSPQALDELAQKQARELTSNKVKTNQIRNLYSTVQRIRALRDRAGTAERARADIVRQFIFLKPRLAYASARVKGLRGLRDTLADAVDQVMKSAKLDAAADNFFALMEAIVAYHYFYGKEEGLAD